MLSLDGKHTISLVSYSCDTKDFRLSAQLFTSCIKLVDESIKDDRESFFFPRERSRMVQVSQMSSAGCFLEFWLSNFICFQQTGLGCFVYHASEKRELFWKFLEHRNNGRNYYGKPIDFLWRAFCLWFLLRLFDTKPVAVFCFFTLSFKYLNKSCLS